nr:MAG TPA: hypothetical protein [Caudoviricetes sp.]
MFKAIITSKYFSLLKYIILLLVLHFFSGKNTHTSL